MKVILVDNFAREIILQDGLSEDEAAAVACKYNEDLPDGHPWHARIVPDQLEAGNAGG